MKTTNGVILWYILAIQHLLHFLASVSSLSISFFFPSFFYEFCYLRRYWGKFGDTKQKQWSCSQVPKWKFEGLVAADLFSN